LALRWCSIYFLYWYKKVQILTLQQMASCTIALYLTLKLSARERAMDLAMRHDSARSAARLAATRLLQLTYRASRGLAIRSTQRQLLATERQVEKAASVLDVKVLLSESLSYWCMRP